MRKIYHLSSCSTCKRILDGMPHAKDIEVQDIKTVKLSAEQLDRLIEMAGSVEALFSKKARNYRIRGLHEKTLSEAEMRELILEDYTFLKRPVAVIGNLIFFGSAPSIVKSFYEAL